MDIINVLANVRGLIALAIEIALNHPLQSLIVALILGFIWFPKGTSNPVIYKSFDRRETNG